MIGLRLAHQHRVDVLKIVEQLVNDPTARVRAFDFLPASDQQKALIRLVTDKATGHLEDDILLELISRLDKSEIDRNPQAKRHLLDLLDTVDVKPTFLALVEKYRVSSVYPKVLKAMRKHKDESIRIAAASTLLELGQTELLKSALAGEDRGLVESTARSLASAYREEAIDLLLPLVTTASLDAESLRQLVREISRVPRGAHARLDMVQRKQLTSDLQEAIAATVLAHSRKDVKERAAALISLSLAKDNQPLPDLQDLVRMAGDATTGRAVFHNQGKCISCQ